MSDLNATNLGVLYMTPEGNIGLAQFMGEDAYGKSSYESALQAVKDAGFTPLGSEQVKQAVDRSSGNDGKPALWEWSVNSRNISYLALSLASNTETGDTYRVVGVYPKPYAKSGETPRDVYAYARLTPCGLQFVSVLLAKRALRMELRQRMFVLLVSTPKTRI